MGVAESRITTYYANYTKTLFVKYVEFVVRRKKIYCNFADKNMTLSHNSVKY